MLVKKYLESIKVKKPRKSGIRYIAIHFDESSRCGKVLIADIYNERGLNSRFFTDSKSWISLMPNGEWSRCKPFDEYRCYDYEYEKNERTLAYNFLKESLPHFYSGDHITLASLLNSFVSDKANESKRRLAEEKKKKMEYHISLFPSELSSEIKNYIKEFVLTNKYILMYRNSRNNKVKYKCLYCGKVFYRKKRQRHRSTCMCPGCKNEGIAIAERFLSSVKDVKKMLIFYKVDDKVLKHYIHVTRTYDLATAKPRYFQETDLYEVWEHGKPYKYKWISMYFVGWAKTKNGDNQDRYVYVDNLNDIYVNAQYNGLNLKRLRYAGAINFDKLIESATKTDTAAKLYKIGLYKLAEDASKLRCGNTFEEVLEISSNYKPLCRKYNITYTELRLIRMSSDHVSEELFQKMRKLIGDNEINLYNKVPKALERVSFIKMINYLSKQQQITKKKSMSTLLTWYIDYFQMSEELNRMLPESKKINTTDMNYRFPKNIKVAHDNVSEKLSCKKDEQLNQEIKRIKFEMGDVYKFDFRGLTLVIPESTDDFIYEGAMLNHCIGRGNGYMKAHVLGKRMSFFIRKQSAPDKPYFTFTLDMGSHILLSECYGLNHKKPSKEINDFIETFINHIEKINRCMIQVQAMTVA